MSYCLNCGEPAASAKCAGCIQWRRDTADNFHASPFGYLFCYDCGKAIESGAVRCTNCVRKLPLSATFIGVIGRDKIGRWSKYGESVDLLHPDAMCSMLRSSYRRRWRVAPLAVIHSRQWVSRSNAATVTRSVRAAPGMTSPKAMGAVDGNTRNWKRRKQHD